jgi:hypothetical protein
VDRRRRSTRPDIDTSQTIGADHNAQFCEITTACTVTLDDAALLGASWHVYLKNTSLGTVVIDRMSVGDTIDGVAANASLGSMDCIMFAVNAGLDGFIKLQDSAGMGSMSGAGGLSDTPAVTWGDRGRRRTRKPRPITSTSGRSNLHRPDLGRDDCDHDW